MISLLYSILSNDTFYQFSGEYWCFALLNMSFDFFDVLLLLSICFLVMLSFGGNFSLSPQRFFPGVALSLFFFLPLCLEMFDMWPNSSRGSGAAPVLPTSHLGISACRAHFPAFRIPGDSIREQFSKANEEKNPRWCFRLWTGFVWLWGGFQKPKIKGILGCQRAVLPYSPLVFLFLSQKQCSWSHFKWELSFGNIFRSFSKSGSVLWGKHWWEAKVWRGIPW